MTFKCYALAFYFFYLTLHMTTSDPCTNYANLDDAQRSTAYARGTAAICDSTITEQWYRSVSGAGPDMPTSAVPVGRCGTQYPLWIDDTFPLSGEEKELKVCMAHIFGDCDQDFKINVKNCSSYNVYYLKRTSGCPMAYCFGGELECPDGKSSLTGFTPCEDVPTVQLSPYVTADLENGNGASENIIHKVLKFDCNLASSTEITDLTYEVRWYIEDNQVAVFQNKSYSEFSSTSLSEDKWKGTYTMGFNVKCRIRAQYKNSTVPGQFQDSPLFYAGVKVSNYSVIVREGEEENVTVWLTVPFGCATFVNTPCAELFLQLREPEYQSKEKPCTNGVVDEGAIVFRKLDCGVHFKHESWNTTQQISITGKRDNIYNSAARITYIRLEADTVPGHRAWDYVNIPDIRVFVEDTETITLSKHCMSSNDPHMTTFDGTSYENQRAGEFILYEHDLYPISVHAMYTECPGIWWTVNRATCNCGVVVKYDDEMFVANFCGTITTGTNNNNSVSSTNRYIENVSCGDTYMTVVNDGSKYKITLPTGTVITFDYGSFKDGEDEIFRIHYIHVKPSVEDIKSSSGLCGYFDGNSGNDFRLRDKSTTGSSDIFALNWWVNHSDSRSLFRYDLNFQKANVSLRQYCVCRSNESTIYSSQIKCNEYSSVETCSATAEQAKAYYTRCSKKRSRRSVSDQGHLLQKRSTDEEDEDEIPRFELTYNPDYTNPPTESKWSNGWNETSARAYCSEHLEQNQMFILCKENIPNYDTDISKTVNDCIDDIKITGTTFYLKASIDALKTICLTEATRLENLTETASTSGNSSKSLLDDILDISCVDNCSGNGTCVGGKCECRNGYEGAYCNLIKTIPPAISAQSNSGKCKTDISACRTYWITGNGFISNSIKCKARHFKIYGNGRQEDTGTLLTFDGTYVNDISCTCTVPDRRKRRAASASTVIADGYYISVSNDGTAYSEEITFINYDSTCYECNVTAVACTEIGTCITTTTTTISTEEPTTTTSTSSAVSTTENDTVVTMDPTSTTTNTSGTMDFTSTATTATAETTDSTSISTTTIAETASATTSAEATDSTFTVTTTKSELTFPTSPGYDKKKTKRTHDDDETNIGVIIAGVVSAVAIVFVIFAIAIFLSKKTFKLKPCVQDGDIYIRPDTADLSDRAKTFRPGTPRSINIGFPNDKSTMDIFSARSNNN